MLHNVIETLFHTLLGLKFVTKHEKFMKSFPPRCESYEKNIYIIVIIFIFKLTIFIYVV